MIYIFRLSAFDIQPVQFSDERDGRIVVEVGHG